MNAQDDYLWSKQGDGEAEIRQLEQLLAPYAHPVTVWRGVGVPNVHAKPARRKSRVWRIGWALAAGLAACALTLGGWLQHRLDWPQDAAWAVMQSHGTVHLAGAPLAQAAQLPLGGELVTGPDSLVRLKIARIGELQLGAGSRLRLEQTAAGQHRVRLRQGRLWARVWAPPGSFGVRLPQAEALDMGCEFTVDIDASGAGKLIVHSGWVLVGNHQSEVLVPQGAMVRLRADGRAGTPHDRNASAGFVAALAELDAEDEDLMADDVRIQHLLAQARPQDVISLLTLLQRHPAWANGPLYARLQMFLVGAPALSREAVLRGELGALEPWWEALPYPRAKHWWLQWPDALPAGRDAAAMNAANTAPR